MAVYCDRRGVLGELLDRPIEIALDAKLRRQIFGGQRAPRLRRISITLDPAQFQASRKIAMMKTISYQTPIR